MRLLRRILLESVTALSLLLALVAGAFWVRGYSAGDQFYYSRWTVWPQAPGAGGRVCWMREWAGWLISGRGGLAVEVRWQESGTGSGPPDTVEPLRATTRSWRMDPAPAHPDGGLPRDTLPRRLGFGYWRGDFYSGWNRRVWAPAWAVAVVFVLLPAWRVRRLVRRYRAWRAAATGARPCPACGYDLRATPERCPECGARAVASVPAGRTPGG